MQAAPIHIIGLGPGDSGLLPPLALAALEQSTVLVGYTLYMDMVPPSLREGKQVIVTGMRQERQRCLAAIEQALGGKRTCVVCSGDAGIYGMSGLILELLARQGHLETVPVEVIPGVPAVCAAAALLGAPLMHDFACVSLSDLLTPWERILQRVRAACSADFVLALYNPRSRGRQDHLFQTLEIVREYRSDDCPVGLVRNAYREGQSVSVHALDDFINNAADSVDMLCLVVIGNESTRHMGQYMVTPRGYDIRT